MTSDDYQQKAKNIDVKRKDLPPRFSLSAGLTWIGRFICNENENDFHQSYALFEMVKMAEMILNNFLLLSNSKMLKHLETLLLHPNPVQNERKQSPNPYICINCDDLK